MRDDVHVLRRRVRADPGDVDAACELIDLLARSGDLDKIVEALGESLETEDPAPALAARFLRAVYAARRQLGDHRFALPWVTRRLVVSPDGAHLAAEGHFGRLAFLRRADLTLLEPVFPGSPPPDPPPGVYLDTLSRDRSRAGFLACGSWAITRALPHGWTLRVLRPGQPEQGDSLVHHLGEDLPGGSTVREVHLSPRGDVALVWALRTEDFLQFRDPTLLRVDLDPETWTVQSRRLLRPPPGVLAEVLSVAFLPGGDEVVLAAAHQVRSDEPAQIVRLRMEDGAVQATREARGWVSALALSPDGQHLAARIGGQGAPCQYWGRHASPERRGSPARVELLKAADLEVVAERAGLEVGEGENAIPASRSRYIEADMGYPELYTPDTEQDPVVSRFDSLAWVSDEACVLLDREFPVVVSRPGAASPGDDAARTGLGMRCLTADGAGEVFESPFASPLLFRRRHPDGPRRGVPQGHVGTIREMRRHGVRLFTRDDRGAAWLWDLEDGGGRRLSRGCARLGGASDSGERAAFLEAGVWRVSQVSRSGVQLLAELPAQASAHCALHPGGERVVLGFPDGSLVERGVAGATRWEAKGHLQVRSLAYVAGGSLLLVVCGVQPPYVWAQLRDADTGEVRHEWMLEGRQTAQLEGRARDLPGTGGVALGFGGMPTAYLPGKSRGYGMTTGSYAGLDFDVSPDGQQIALLRKDRVRVLRLQGRQLLREVEFWPPEGAAVQFREDGRRLLVATRNRVVEVGGPAGPGPGPGS